MFDDVRAAVESLVTPDVSTVYVFGSRARGDESESSDLDIGVVVDNPLGFDVFSFAAGLEDELGVDVDCVVLNDASVMLCRRVLVEGVVVYERSEQDRVSFEVGARRAYFDMKPRARQRADERRERLRA